MIAFDAEHTVFNNTIPIMPVGSTAICLGLLSALLLLLTFDVQH